MALLRAIATKGAMLLLLGEFIEEFNSLDIGFTMRSFSEAWWRRRELNKKRSILEFPCKAIKSNEIQHK